MKWPVTAGKSCFRGKQSRPERFTRFIGDKVHFAKNVVPNVAAEHFTTFAPIFANVERIINQDT